jgi:hypothetical protein
MAEIVIGPKGQAMWDASRKTAVFGSTGSWVYRERARDAALEWRDTQIREALRRSAPRIASLMKNLEELSKRDDYKGPTFAPTTAVRRQLGTMRHNEGKIIGVESTSGTDEKAPVYHSLRIDVDDDKGPHYNVQVRGGGDTFKACFRFDAPAGKDPKEWVAKIQSKWSR